MTQDRILWFELIAELHDLIGAVLSSRDIPKSVAELAALMHCDRYNFWKRCEVELHVSPSECLDFIRGKRMLQKLNTDAEMKLLSVHYDIGLKSEDGFRRFCKRAFNALPREVKANPKGAEVFFETKFAALLKCFARVEGNKLRVKTVGVSVKQNRHTKPTYKTDIQNRHTKGLGKRKRESNME
jgi:AraC-like DNA-binding protein